MFDMSKIKVGDTVTLRNGEDRTVAEVKLLNPMKIPDLLNPLYPYSVQFQCSKNQTWHDYTEDGHWLSWEDDPWDIVEIKGV